MASSPSGAAAARTAVYQLFCCLGKRPAGDGGKDEESDDGASPSCFSSLRNAPRRFRSRRPREHESQSRRRRRRPSPAHGQTSPVPAEDAAAGARDSSATNSESRARLAHRTTTQDIAMANPMRLSEMGKENVRPAASGRGGTGLAAAFGELSLAPAKTMEGLATMQDAALVKEREQNLRFIDEALEMARLALRTNETPVGCVLVHEGRIIAKGMNATNVMRNGTRHAELMAISALLSVSPRTGPKTTSLKPKELYKPAVGSTDDPVAPMRAPDEGNEDGNKSHLYPYGQRLVGRERVDPKILRNCVLYVTVEPCVMCASLLRQFGIKKVYFGAVNDKFGGTGGVFSIHANSLPVRADGQTAWAHPLPQQQAQLPDGSGTLGTYPPGGGDGGDVEPGYEIEGCWGRDEAVALLRRFYVQENGRAPVPRKKEGRGARLAAMTEKDVNTSTEALTEIEDVTGHEPAALWTTFQGDGYEQSRRRR